ncbi:MAG: YeeE/YedE family protein, partial [Casimicrobium sp.]
MHPFLWSLIGGLLIGVATWIMVAGLGRIAGISGIAATAIFAPRDSAWRFVFLFGLIVGGAAFALLFDRVSPAVASKTLLVVAGLLVGFGTVLGSGCTSGHGVCGLARFSIRSLISVLSFMVVGALTVALIRYTGVGV